jgi:predicted CXXCH cytochrome family protein
MMMRAVNIGRGFIMVITVFMVGQCSPYAGHKMLTFFFDGVPEEDSITSQDSENEGLMIDSTSLATGLSVPDPEVPVLHYPYGERDCAACHDPNSMESMTEPQPGLCYTCHTDLSTQFQYLHGPAAGGYCTACHDPHQSESEKLLRFTGERLCFYCHKAESVYKNEMHRDLDGMLCTECHHPHGGEDRYIFQ